MKKLLSFLVCSFIGIAAFAHTIDWYVDGSIYQTTTCNSGEDITPPAAPAKYGYTFTEWLPYIPIEYIQSTGAQYIDTGYKYNTNATTITYQFDMSLESENSAGISHRKIAGLYSSTAKRPLSISLYTDNQIRVSGGNITFNNSNVKDNFTPGVRFNISAQINHSTKRISLIKDSGTAKTQSYSDNITESDNLYFFTYNTFTTPNPNYMIYAKMYSAKIYEDNTLVRDFIPVLDKNGTPCMYDLAERKFYYNSGTGNFIAGPEL